MVLLIFVTVQLLFHLLFYYCVFTVIRLEKANLQSKYEKHASFIVFCSLVFIHVYFLFQSSSFIFDILNIVFLLSLWLNASIYLMSRLFR
jgi:hypothetical protein